MSLAAVRDTSVSGDVAVSAAEETHALESAFRRQAEANQQVVQGLMGLLREGCD